MIALTQAAHDLHAAILAAADRDGLFLIEDFSRAAAAAHLTADESHAAYKEIYAAGLIRPHNSKAICVCKCK